MSTKRKNLEKELDSLGLTYWNINCRKEYCSGSTTSYEGFSYLLRLAVPGGSINHGLRKKLAGYADQAGMYVKFSALNMHTVLTEEVLRASQTFFHSGVVAIFYPKFPYSRAKKVLREIQESTKNSFDYYQEDEACLKKLQAAKILEKDVLSISKVDNDLLIYTGSEELHPLTRVAYLVGEYVRKYDAHESDDHLRDLNVIMHLGQLLLHVPFPHYVGTGH